MQDTPIAVISALESAKYGTSDLCAKVLACAQHESVPSPPPNPTKSLDAAIELIPPYYWWEVTRRKNMPDYDAPNPANGRHHYLAYVGLHARASGKGNKKGAPGRGHTPQTALCAALINAMKLELHHQ